MGFYLSRITNEASILFITCNGLTNLSKAVIKGKPCKSLGVIHLYQIEKWESVKEYLIR